MCRPRRRSRRRGFPTESPRDRAIWPQAPDLTRLVAEWHFQPDEIATPGFVCDDAIDFWDRTNREDWAISERSYRGISSRGYAPGPYSNRERQLWEFDQFVIKKVGPI